MRVAINVEQLLSASPGGIGRYSAQLATLLSRVQPVDEVVPFVGRHRRGDATRALVAAGVMAAPVLLPLPRGVVYQTWVRWALPPLALGAGRLGRVDLVHAPSVAVPPRGRIPLVVTVHDAASERWPEAFTPRGRRFHALGMAAAARRADLVIAPSEAAAAEIADHSPIDADRIRVVAHGIDPPPQDPLVAAARLGAAGLTDRPYVLWVGSLEPRKGVATVVEAMAQLRSGGTGRAGGSGRCGGAALVLAGYPGWLSETTVSPTARRALGADLIELGRVDDTGLWALYRGATVFAFPSSHEGFGLPPLEAMSQGAAVVCSDLPATREVLGDGAWLLPAGDVGAWADALGALLADSSARDRLGAAGRIRAERYGIGTWVEATRAVYREALGSGS